MHQKAIAAYGSWRSPISAALVASQTLDLRLIQVSGADVYWLEMRPLEGGRYSIVRRAADGTLDDVIPADCNARTRAHEYGGGAYFVHGSTVFFSNYNDQRMYRLDPGGDLHPITPEPAVTAGLRYADGRVTPDGETIICVREEHRDDGNVLNTLVSFAPDGSREAKIIASGRDFYSFPRISADGKRLAWTCWDFPLMPWEGSELWVADLTVDGSIQNEHLVAGGKDESIFQPEWNESGTLHFISDRSGWWNLYREHDGAAEALAPTEAELGVPQWLFGLSRYAFMPDGRIACIYKQNGVDHLGLIPAQGGSLERLDSPYNWLRSLHVSDGRLWFIGGGEIEASSIVALNVDDGSIEVVRRILSAVPDEGYLSRPEPIEFPTDGGLTAYALYYAPTNRDYTGADDERPPLLVISHGGPTSAARVWLQLKIQYWSSRGFAVVDVNYGGSTGYGRAYRKRLDGQWGVVDTADCVNAAKYLVEQGKADGARLAIRGGSAGGYTTFNALTFTDVFAAGASYYGVSDAAALALDTHKFESRYLDNLIGPYPEAKDIYEARSSIHFTNQLSCPVILFQGEEDLVVLPSQAELMVSALQEKGIPHAYLLFEGEQHGFRRAETIQRALEAELYFYSRIFNFDLTDDIEPVDIKNL